MDAIDQRIAEIIAMAHARDRDGLVRHATEMAGSPKGWLTKLVAAIDATDDLTRAFVRATMTISEYGITIECERTSAAVFDSISDPASPETAAELIHVVTAAEARDSPALIRALYRFAATDVHRWPVRLSQTMGALADAAANFILSHVHVDTTTMIARFGSPVATLTPKSLVIQGVCPECHHGIAVVELESPDHGVILATMHEKGDDDHSCTYANVKTPEEVAAELTKATQS